MRIRVVLASIAIGLAPAVYAQNFQVDGHVPKPRAFSREELRAMIRAEQKVDGVVYSGVLVSRLLRVCGAEVDNPKNRELAKWFTITGGDGFTTTFSLAEASAKFHDVDALLADEVNGHDIPPPEGPFRILTKDKEGRARWVKNASTLIVREWPPARKSSR